MFFFFFLQASIKAAATESTTFPTTTTTIRTALNTCCVSAGLYHLVYLFGREGKQRITVPVIGLHVFKETMFNICSVLFFFN